MILEWRPYREPLRATVVRTGIIALVLGAVFAQRFGGFAFATLLMLWPAFGGHWVEIFFLNWVRPRLAGDRVVQVGARVGVWFVGGLVIALGMGLTTMMVRGVRLGHWRGVWVGGIVFIGVELVAHLVLQVRGRPSFYDGRG